MVVPWAHPVGHSPALGGENARQPSLVNETSEPFLESVSVKEIQARLFRSERGDAPSEQGSGRDLET